MATRLTKYLRQTAQFEAVTVGPNGKPSLNDYGEPAYAGAITVRCRKEPYKAVEGSISGQYVEYSYTYYLDNSVQPKVGDKLDGMVVQQVTDYIDGLGKLVGYEVSV